MLVSLRFVALRLLGLLATFLMSSSAFAAVTEYEGSWTNQTFGSTGAAHGVLNISPPTISFSLDLDGNVFGGTDPTPLVLTGTLNPDMSATFNPVVGHPTYGDVTGSATATGQLSATGTNIPNQFITGFSMSGQFTPAAINMTYTVTFPQGAPANGIIQMNVVPEPLSAGGVWAVSMIALMRRRRCDAA